MRYLITGGSGFIGVQICASLYNKESSKLVVLTRNPHKTQQILALHGISDAQCMSSLEEFYDPVDVIINLAGRGIFDKRWSAKFKEELLRSRIDTTKVLYNYVQRIETKPSVCISASAVGIYGEQVQETDESGELGNGFAATLCKKWEDGAKTIEDLGVRTCIMRLGVVIGKGGMLKKTLPSIKFGMGAYFGDGSMYMPWVHVDDVVSSVHHFLDSKIQGTFNIVAPELITNKVFMDSLAHAIGRKIYLRIPHKILMVLFGEGATEVLIPTQKITPTALTSSGYKFNHNTIKSALKAIL